MLREYGFTEMEVFCWNELCREYGRRFAVGILAQGHYDKDGEFVEDYATYHDAGCWACEGELEPFEYFQRR